MATESNAGTDKPTQRLSAAVERRAPGLIREFWGFVADNRKWWLVPILVSLLVIAALVILGASPLGPFIYPLF